MTSRRDALLGDYLRRAAAIPFAWGTHDCCLFASGWVLAATDVDPAAAFRGRYASEAEASRFVAEAGGLAALMAPHMARLAETREPVPGDIGAIAAGGVDLVAVRVHGERWACLSPRGLVVTPARLIRGWSICRLS